ncbi:RNA polymerase sigma factor [Terriglobus sp. 2YAB30_2]|uniref:RNA polymerase sigma factor n=2 Tax=unclassified Terriglobus TaxID=2628988 RepID=UPI003F986D2C
MVREMVCKPEERMSGAGEGTSDEQLMLAFASGITPAFEELYARYRNPLCGFFRRRLKEPSVADELAQETWMAVVRSAPHYRPSATFRTYLYAIALKQLRSFRRKAAFRAMFWSSEEVETATARGADTGFVLRDAVAKLEAIDREVVMLREFEELSYAEIAALLSLPVNTVRSRLFRARTALRDLLQGTAQADGSRQKEGV